MTSYVYILPHKTESRFKIGKANDVHSRMDQLGFEQFELTECKKLKFKTERDALNFEKTLHVVFDKYRLEKIGDFDGATEWFDKEGYDNVLGYIEYTSKFTDLKIDKVTKRDITPTTKICNKTKDIVLNGFEELTIYNVIKLNKVLDSIKQLQNKVDDGSIIVSVQESKYSFVIHIESNDSIEELCDCIFHNYQLKFTNGGSNYCEGIRSSNGQAELTISKGRVGHTEERIDIVLISIRRSLMKLCGKDSWFGFEQY